jgi:hypothetical protein
VRQITAKETEMKAWGGYVNDKLDVDKKRNEYDEPRYAIFPTRRAAKQAYSDVRRIKVRIYLED